MYANAAILIPGKMVRIIKGPLLFSSLLYLYPFIRLPSASGSSSIYPRSHLHHMRSSNNLGVIE